MVTFWMCKKKSGKGIIEGMMDRAQRSANQWECGMDLSVQTNLTYYFSGDSEAKPSISGFVLNSKPLVGVFVSGNY